MVGAQKQVGVVGDASVDGMVGVQFVPPAHGLPAELAETRCGLPRVQGAPVKILVFTTGWYERYRPCRTARSTWWAESQASRRCGQTTLRPTLPHLRIGYHACSTQACGQATDRDVRRFSRHRCGMPISLSFSFPESPQYSSISGSISFLRMSWYHYSRACRQVHWGKRNCAQCKNPGPRVLLEAMASFNEVITETI